MTPNDEPQIADPTIEQVLDQFLAEQRQRLKAQTFSRYEDVVSLLRDHLDGYAYDGLSKEEEALFDKYYNAKGDEHREFCQLFGPDEIVPNLDMFLSYFMIRKVVAGAALMRAAGTVTKKLSKWLAEQGYIAEDEADDGAAQGAEAARNLPAAERAAAILYDAADALDYPDDARGEEYRDFDHYTIARLLPGKLWLRQFAASGDAIGPIAVPTEATELLQNGWDISCSLVRLGGAWRLAEVANVYPL